MIFSVNTYDIAAQMRAKLKDQKVTVVQHDRYDRDNNAVHVAVSAIVLDVVARVYDNNMASLEIQYLPRSGNPTTVVISSGKSDRKFDTRLTDVIIDDNSVYIQYQSLPSRGGPWNHRISFYLQ